jgi:hypothetical protein
MSASSESNGRPSDPQLSEGVLANLPRTRPQRSSARRAAARTTSATPPAAPTSTRGRSASRGTAPKASERAPAKARPARAKTGQAPAKARKTVAPSPTPAAKASAPAKPRAKRAKPAPADTSVPRQGFESDFDRASGPVAPPGGAELVATAAEIFGELAKAGISTGERLLKDVLTRLPLS